MAESNQDGIAPGEGESYATGGPPLADRSQDEPCEFTTNVPLAYEPSGAWGNVVVLLMFGALAIGVGVTAGLASAAVVGGIDYVHQLLPVYIFVVPILLLLLMAATPAVMGIAVGAVVSKGVTSAHCRSAGLVTLIALPATVASLGLLHSGADAIVPDGVLRFIRVVIAGCVNFEWGVRPEPASVPGWVIYLVLGVSALIGVGIAWRSVAGAVRSSPYCEDCGRYMDHRTLWQVPPPHAQALLSAFRQMDLATAAGVVRCEDFDNHVSVELHTCPCGTDAFVELIGHTKEPPTHPSEEPSEKASVRLFSASLSAGKAERLVALSDRR